MIRWYRRPRPLATHDVLAYRAGGSLVLIVAYAALRAPSITTWAELIVTLVIGGAVVLFGLNAFTELAVRDRDWMSVDAPSPLEITEIVPLPLIAWPTHEPTDDELIYQARQRAAFVNGHTKVIDRGEFVDTEPLRLFTHEFNSAHTPPSGFPVMNWDEYAAGQHRLERGRHAADREAPPSPTPRTARHALADSMITRERSHGQFGVW